MIQKDRPCGRLKGTDLPNNLFKKKNVSEKMGAHFLVGLADAWRTVAVTSQKADTLEPLFTQVFFRIIACRMRNVEQWWIRMALCLVLEYGSVSICGRWASFFGKRILPGALWACYDCETKFLVKILRQGCWCWRHVSRQRDEGCTVGLFFAERRRWLFSSTEANLLCLSFTNCSLFFWHMEVRKKK